MTINELAEEYYKLSSTQSDLKESMWCLSLLMQKIRAERNFAKDNHYCHPNAIHTITELLRHLEISVIWNGVSAEGSDIVIWSYKSRIYNTLSDALMEIIRTKDKE